MIWQKWIGEEFDFGNMVLAARGCPFNCPYCSNHALRRVASGKYLRFRQTDKIIEEIRIIAADFPGQRLIDLQIETFTGDQWALELCSKLEFLNREFLEPLSFTVKLRMNKDKDYAELLAACKKSNFKYLRIGLESGSERLRRQVLHRDYSNAEFLKVMRQARECGLKVLVFNLIGIPGETYSDYQETVKINRLCLPDMHATAIFFPYPGTDLYDLAKNQGLLSEPLDTRTERSRANLDLPGFSKQQIQKAFEWFDYDEYKGRLPLAKILFRVFELKIRVGLPKVHYFLRRIVRWKIFKWAWRWIKQY